MLILAGYGGFVTPARVRRHKLRTQSVCVVIYYKPMQLRDIRQVDVRKKRVLVRVDYNIATDARGRPRDLSRMHATLPTLQWLVRHGAQVIVVTHRGRPHGRERSLSLRPFVGPLRRILKQPVVFIDAPLFSARFDDQLTAVKRGQVALLENIRFEPGEEDNSPAVAKRLGRYADLVVNDAFAESHRAHASVVGIARIKPVYAGLLLQREVEHLTSLVRRPARPFVAIIGGSKISTKLGLIKRLLRTADAVLLGGALANTLLQAEGLAIGSSLTEPSMLKAAEGLTTTNTKLKIPCDVVVATKKQLRAKTRVTAVGRIGVRDIILDIGPDTIEMYRRIIGTARTVVWNGPMGVYELPPFDRGTVNLAKVIAEHHCLSIAGGGETVDAIRRAGVEARFSFLSTGGGAMLEFLEGQDLPGVAVVRRR